MKTLGIRLPDQPHAQLALVAPRIFLSWGGVVRPHDRRPARHLPPLNFAAAEAVAVAVSLSRADSTQFAAAAKGAMRKSAPAIG